MAPSSFTQRRDRHVEDRVVDDDHEQAQAEHAEDPPAQLVGAALPVERDQRGGRGGGGRGHAGSSGRAGRITKRYGSVSQRRPRGSEAQGPARITAMQDPDGARLARRLRRRTVLLALGASLLGAVMAVAYLSVLSPTEGCGDCQQGPQVEILGGVISFLVLGGIGVRVGDRIYRSLRWLPEGRAPTDRERRSTLRFPGRVALTLLVAWTAAAAGTSGVLALQGADGRALMRTASTVLLGRAPREHVQRLRPRAHRAAGVRPGPRGRRRAAVAVARVAASPPPRLAGELGRPAHHAPAPALHHRRRGPQRRRRDHLQPLPARPGRRPRHHRGRRSRHHRTAPRPAPRAHPGRATATST